MISSDIHHEEIIEAMIDVFVANRIIVQVPYENVVKNDRDIDNLHWELNQLMFDKDRLKIDFYAEMFSSDWEVFGNHSE